METLTFSRRVDHSTLLFAEGGQERGPDLLFAEGGQKTSFFTEGGRIHFLIRGGSWNGSLFVEVK
jgi:hypothetical protein